MVYLEPVFLADLPIQPGVHRNLMQINHSAAVVTDKVIVRVDVCIIALLSVDHRHTLYRPLLPEEVQVPVDSAQRQIRMGWLEPLINPVSRGVDMGGADGLQNGLTLFAVPDGALHTRLLNSSNSCLQNYNSIPVPVCEEVFSLFRKNFLGRMRAGPADCSAGPTVQIYCFSAASRAETASWNAS